MWWPKKQPNMTQCKTQLNKKYLCDSFICELVS